jgi:hypothetical protein
MDSRDLSWPEPQMAKNTKAGNASRAARLRERLRERGITSLTIQTTAEGRPLLKLAADLITRETNPLTAASALRVAAGGNEPPEENQAAKIAELKARAVDYSNKGRAYKKRALEAEAELAKIKEIKGFRGALTRWLIQN